MNFILLLVSIDIFFKNQSFKKVQLIYIINIVLK